MRSDIAPGLLVLQGNRTEVLADTLLAWLRSTPLAPLEEEVFLVQSNGVAEWLKMRLADSHGICAATRVELPARFLWRAYRQMLGRNAVPARSVFDKAPLTWRLMQCLPDCIGRPGFEPLAGFLQRGGIDRRLQLAQQLADLYDQYQMHRGDWLAAWADGDDRLPRHEGDPSGPRLAPDQRWQALLWRVLLAPLSAAERAATRPQLQRRFLAALASGAGPVTPLPRRIVLFGMSHLPPSTLVAVAALARHSQVLLAIPNPCRYHWADILPGRDLLMAPGRHQPLRQGRDLAVLPLDQMHDHAHPLLAAWGRQGRDFVRQLDAFDDRLTAQDLPGLPRLDLFDDGPGTTLLQQVQARIRDLVPLAEHPALAVPPRADDKSIVFHVAHGAQREVEILHDQLLTLLAPGGLAPRDIVVMVPDVELFAAAVRSVFGQYGRNDARFIPFDIADLPERGRQPLLVAMEWLLGLPQHRCTASELRDLLDVPALAARFGLAADDLPLLAQWIEGAGVRWGLSADHRTALGLGASGSLNTWAFGLQRMLLGYANGTEAFAGIEPYAEVGGLQAAAAGALAALVHTLQDWQVTASTPAPPAVWADRGRRLIASLLAPTDDAERQAVAALETALVGWLDACDAAAFDQPVPLTVAREAWLSGVEEPGLNRRFRAGGVTVCTLLPMRAIPFQVVCLLGMNDGDYPRRARRSDFDLMATPGQARPGDRSRRDDDRQLMLEALLSARQLLYVSWAGRSVRDNSSQPPSVLVSQLRDYLAAGWGDAVVAERTTEHPLQPFSRCYFEAGSALFTHAVEWRGAHTLPDDATPAPTTQAFEPDVRQPLSMAALVRFLKNPTREYFRQRLGVVYRDGTETDDDDEPLELDTLQDWALVDDSLRAFERGALDVPVQVARLRAAGRLPLAGPGDRAAQDLAAVLTPMLVSWQTLLLQHPQAASAPLLRFDHADLALVDSLDGLRDNEPPVWLALQAGRWCNKAHKLRADKLIGPWVRLLLASSCGLPLRGLLVGRDATIQVLPLPADTAASALKALLAAWRDGMNAPLPLMPRTALAIVTGKGVPAKIYEGNSQSRGEVAEPCLARCFPDFATLAADGRLQTLAQALWAPLAAWAERQVSLVGKP